VASKLLGEILLAARPAVPTGGPPAGLTVESIAQALQTQTAEGGRIGEILVKMNATLGPGVVTDIRTRVGLQGARG